MPVCKLSWTVEAACAALRRQPGGGTPHHAGATTLTMTQFLSPLGRS